MNNHLNKMVFLEKGRSMVEILGTLAVIGLLTFTATKFWVYLNSKHKAGLLVKELGMVHSQLNVKSNRQASDWEVYPFSSALPYVFFKRYDSTGNDFIQINGIGKAECKALLEHSIYTFYTTDNDPLTECQDENEIVVAFKKNAPVPFSSSSGSDPDQLQCEEDQYFDGTGCQDKCTQASDCGSSDRDYCDADQHCAQCEEDQYFDGSGCQDKCTQALDCGSSDRDYCDGDGHCQKCNEGMSYDSTYEECFQVCTVSQRSCDDGTSKWCCSLDLACGRADGNRCICEVTDDCGEGFNGYCNTQTGACIECTETQYMERGTCIDRCLTDNDCSDYTGRCNAVTGRCVSACTSLTQYLDINGTCQNCDSGNAFRPLSEYECLKCNANAEYIRYMDGDLCKRSSCKRLNLESTSSCQTCGKMASATPKNARTCSYCEAFLAGLDGEEDRKCQLCSINAPIAAEEANCNMCNTTDYPREMKDGKCVLVCKGQKQCHKGDDYWCCPETLECDETGDSKCLPSTKGRCRYKLTGSSYGPYAVDTDTDCGCPQGQYCFGKWNKTGQILKDSFVGTEYIYGVCISMNHSIDTPVKDKLNPWTSNQLDNPSCSE